MIKARRGAFAVSWPAVCSMILLAACAKPRLEPPSDSSSIDASGTTAVTRIIPMPPTVSPAAREWLASLGRQTYAPQTLAERRAATDRWREKDSAEAKRIFPVKIEPKTMAGVRTDVITPVETPKANRGCVLINLHGGGFNSDSGSLIEGIPIANLAKMQVISVYYRLAPENPFPAQVEDVVAVYKEVLKDHQPKNVGIFGTSAGGILTAEVAVKLKELGMPLPGALGLFSILADFSQPGDSQSFFALNGLAGPIAPADPNKPLSEEYAPGTDPSDPVLSPLHADLHGLPPTLLVTSTRDLLLSNTAIFHRALLRSGVDSQLVVYEALPHAFWYHLALPETTETLDLMAAFFKDKLVK